ncbi:MAG TPA: hypothetical protein VJL86_02850 [Steroidobacteraceae bacterium]|nr:hypothetical protein [Steroidobacteraceae bacterium]
MSRPPQETRREMPEPSPHWPGGITADDDPTPVESALAALKFGAILAAGMTIAFFYLATYSGFVAPRAGASLAVLAAFVLPSVVAALRTAWARRRRRPPGA